MSTPPRSDPYQRIAYVLLTLVIIAEIALFAPLARAADPPRYGSFGVGVGTHGMGIDYAYPVSAYLDVRLGYDFGSLTFNYDDEDEEAGTSISGDAKLKFSSAKLLADIKPFKGGFRISTGLYTGSPELDLDASGADDYDIGEGSYRGDLDAEGNIDLGSTAPYLGIGWGGTAGTSGFGASFDIGVIFASSPKVELDIAGTACDLQANEGCDPNDPAEPTRFTIGDGSAQDQQFQANKEAEIAEVEDDAKDFDMWPVIRLGLHYRF